MCLWCFGCCCNYLLIVAVTGDFLLQHDTTWGSECEKKFQVVFFRGVLIGLTFI